MSKVDQTRGSRHGSGAKARRAASRLTATSIDTPPVHAQAEAVNIDDDANFQFTFTPPRRGRGAWADLTEAELETEYGSLPEIGAFPISGSGTGGGLGGDCARVDPAQATFLVAQSLRGEASGDPAVATEHIQPPAGQSVDLPAHIKQEKFRHHHHTLVEHCMDPNAAHVREEMVMRAAGPHDSLGDFLAAQYLALGSGDDPDFDQVNSLEAAQQNVLDDMRQLRHSLLRSLEAKGIIAPQGRRCPISQTQQRPAATSLFDSMD